MMWRILTRVSLQAVCVGAGLVAQVPSHATVLNPAGRIYEPQLTRVGDTVHACGAVPGFPNLYWIYYARSEDGGRTWPVREVPLAYAGEFNRIAADGDLVVVLVKSRYFGPHTITSTDGGSSWSLPVRISQHSIPQVLFGADLHVSGTTVSVCWYEDRPGGRAWFNQSTDGGISWRPVDVSLDAGLMAGPLVGLFYSMNLFVDGAVMNVIWDHWGAAGQETVNQRSLDGGLSWLPAGQVVTTSSMDEAAGDGSLLFVSEYPSSNLWRSADAGVTWSLVTGHGLQNPRRLVVDGQIVMLVGQYGSSPVTTVEADVSTDGGVSWLPAPFTVQTSFVALATPRVAGDGLFLQVRFFGVLPPTSTGAVHHSIDDGATWRQLVGEAGVAVWPFENSCLVTTRTLLTGDDLHAYVMTGHTTVGAGTVGTGGIAPELTAVGLPSLGRTFSLHVRRARGGSLGMVGVSFAAPSSIPLGAGMLYLQGPIVPLWFLTAGAGWAWRSVTIPTSVSFAGLPFVSQAFVLDPAAVGGFTMTNAMETWIQ